uniref:RNA-directed DNA polymerase, eukaryota n=1 Tax=Tanacetum cinerariifolium TaxID=118510 RepID=A0A699X1T4_TANCI|nr:RNA-directed DNA polymerase, eukaryota [Tanacetum cinerariifolium]
MDFVSKERVVWVDIEGVPLHGWTRATFNKIRSKWEKALDLEEGNEHMFARKRCRYRGSSPSWLDEGYFQQNRV